MNDSMIERMTAAALDLRRIAKQNYATIDCSVKSHNYGGSDVVEVRYASYSTATDCTYGDTPEEAVQKAVKNLTVEAKCAKLAKMQEAAAALEVEIAEATPASEEAEA